MIQHDRIQRVKKISIVQYLESMGAKPVRYSGIFLFYSTSFTKEAEKTFYVNSITNRFRDKLTEDTDKDIISLVKEVFNVSFYHSVELLEAFIEKEKYNKFNSNTYIEDLVEIQILGQKPLKNQRFARYFQDKFIPFPIACKYLTECHCTINGLKKSIIGFKNKSGGYVLSTTLQTLYTLPKDITIIRGSETDMIVTCYSDFISFLSALSLDFLDSPKTDTIILNSEENLPKALPMLQSYNYVYSFLNEANFKKLSESGVKCIDSMKVFREKYPDCKDLNSCLCKISNTFLNKDWL